MGLFGDVKQSMDAALAMSADDAVCVPAQRVESGVTDPVTGEPMRRTDYAGTVWYGGRPQLTGGHPLSGRHSEISTPFWVPDSHAYEPAAAGVVQIQASAAVQGATTTSAGGSLMILDVAAALGEDPAGSGALLLFVSVNAVAGLPFGVVYRVTVISAPAALRPATA